MYQISDIHFKLHLLPIMWPVLVEFRPASSEGSRRKKKDESRKYPYPILHSTLLPSFAEGHQQTELNQTLPNIGR